MALEVRYVPMVDEGDNGVPKIMRVIYNEEGTALTYAEANSLEEVQQAQPDCIEEYFNLVKNYFTDVAIYFDTKTAADEEVYERMLAVARMCFGYVEKNPLDRSE
jgi:hypothetical protein